MIRLSAITPSGQPTLGNYLGALRTWAREGTHEDVYFISDLHAMTSSHNPQRLRSMTREQLAVLVASGIDPASVCVQSDLIRELGALNWVLECTCTYGEAARMIQFKEKSLGRESVRLSLLTYPVLMAADILLYDADRVPVGDDQRQHLELTRNLAQRFNSRFGETFVVPEAVIPPPGRGDRIMDLQEPQKKMSKSSASQQGTIGLFDSPAIIERKIKRAVTDTETEVRYDPKTKPGVSNLLEILAASAGGDPRALAEGYANYGSLKADVAAALIEKLRPVQERYRELAGDPAATAGILGKGAAKAESVAAVTLERARTAIGLLPR